MTTRKRKSPERRRTVKERSLPSRLLAGVGSAVARNPKPATGAAAFIVAFSFVAANALWYQPGQHPAPFLATRDDSDPNAIAGYRPFRREPAADVTTFKIERAPARDRQKTSLTTQSAPAVEPPADVQQADASTAPTAAPAVVDPVVVAGIQRELARRGLYQGADDGLMGPRTTAAILFFEETAGLPERGEPTADLLNLLQAQSQQSVAAAAQPTAPAQPAAPMPLPVPMPRQAPSETRSAALQTRPAPKAIAQPARAPATPPAAQKVSLQSEDPVAAAIRASDFGSNLTPPADIPGIGSGRARSAAPIPSSQMVLQIQKGLANIAYTDVEVDGVAGTQTKAAIRRFQKHYRLPETGEPDEMVLRKLKAIGAL
jgi:peptidoglycan hydrolase-like protein with peptidoglycan-binding domain